MLIQLGNDDQVEATKDVKSVMAEHARAFSTQDVLRMMKAFNTAAVDTRGGWQPSLSLELAVAEVLEAPAEASVVRQEEKPAKAKKAVPSAQKAVTKDESEKAKAAKPPARKTEPEKKSTKNIEEAVPVDSKSKDKAAVIGLAEVAKAWRDIRSIIKPDHPGIEALLNSCKPLEVRGNDLYLGFQSETVRALMDIKEKKDIAKAAIKDVLGVDLSIKCVVTNSKGQLPPNVNPDGMVATAIQNGGEIVDVQD
jgi:DNA polymerase-3 subunit gamma/tau